MGERRLKIGGSEPSANYEIKNKNCKIKYMIKWRKKMFQYFLCRAIMSLDGLATNFYPTFCYIKILYLPYEVSAADIYWISNVFE